MDIFGAQRLESNNVYLDVNNIYFNIFEKAKNQNQTIPTL